MKKKIIISVVALFTLSLFATKRSDTSEFVLFNIGKVESSVPKATDKKYPAAANVDIDSVAAEASEEGAQDVACLVSDALAAALLGRADKQNNAYNAYKL